MQWSLQQINLGGKTSGPKAVGDPFVSVFNGQEHFAYRAEGGAIWDAWYDPGSNHWNLQEINLGGNTGGALAQVGPSVGVYNNQQHFVYVSGPPNPFSGPEPAIRRPDRFGTPGTTETATGACRRSTSAAAPLVLKACTRPRSSPCRGSNKVRPFA